MAGARHHNLLWHSFGHLTVIGLAPKRPGWTSQFWRCLCKCGRFTEVDAYGLRSGSRVSCGCAQHRHGHARAGHRSSEYGVWAAMIHRCHGRGNRRRPKFKSYAGRGIRVCTRWRGPSGFAAFIADMGPRPSLAHSLDRKDVNGHYDPSNCRWATRKQQDYNKQGTVYLSARGRRLPLIQWASEVGLPRHVLYNRIRMGWPVERALSEPRKVAA